jgi:hypothetical protein
MVGALADLRNRKAALLLSFVSWEADWFRHTHDLLAAYLPTPSTGGKIFICDQRGFGRRVARVG